MESAFKEQLAGVTSQQKVTVTAGTGDGAKSVIVTVDVPENGTLTVTDIDAATGKVKAMTYVRGDRQITMTDEVWGEVEPVGSGD